MGGWVGALVSLLTATDDSTAVSGIAGRSELEQGPPSPRQQRFHGVALESEGYQVLEAATAPRGSDVSRFRRLHELGYFDQLTSQITADLTSLLYPVDGDRNGQVLE